MDVRAERKRKSDVNLGAKANEEAEDLDGFYFPQMDGEGDKEVIDRSSSPRRN